MFRQGHERRCGLIFPLLPDNSASSGLARGQSTAWPRRGPSNGGNCMRTRPMAKLAAVGIVGALALAGCGSSDNKSSSGGGLSGGGSGSSSSSTYTIAFEGPLSGDNAQLGINEVNGAQLAVDQANADSSLGFKLKLLKADDVGDPAKAPAAAAQVIQNSNVMGEVGPSFSGATQAVAGKYGDAGISIVNPSASNGTLEDQGFKTWHRDHRQRLRRGPQGRRLAGQDLQEGHRHQRQERLRRRRRPGGLQGAEGQGRHRHQPGRRRDQHQGLRPGRPDREAVGCPGDVLRRLRRPGQPAGQGARGGQLQGPADVRQRREVDRLHRRAPRRPARAGTSPAVARTPARLRPRSSSARTTRRSSTPPPSTYSSEAYDATNILIQAIKTAKARRLGHPSGGQRRGEQDRLPGHHRAPQLRLQR